ncbi:hypothetical protein EJ110_NYTH33150 [Nymphaea thermarum]|nr:hypothetical protein EJ110_NYTH33150 [Nymphaea thermarum]
MACIELLCLSPCYHNKYMKRRHLIDVTEIFRLLNVEKKYRMVCRYWVSLLATLNSTSKGVGVQVVLYPLLVSSRALSSLRETAATWLEAQDVLKLASFMISFRVKHYDAVLIKGMKEIQGKRGK